MNDSTMNILKNEVQGKRVVVDTSSLLMAGTSLLQIIDNCTLVIPAIVVKELEDKRTHSTLGFLAREWLRLLEDLRVENGKQLSLGILLKNYNNIKLQVEPNHRSQASLPPHLQDGSNDSTILSVAKNLYEENNDVVILSNDAPMRLYSTLDLNIPAYEFNATQIIGAKPFDGRYEIKLSDDEYSQSDLANSYEKDSLESLTKIIKDKLPVGHSKTAFITVLTGEKVIYELILQNEKLRVLKRKNKASEITARTSEQDVAFEYLKASVDDITVCSLGGSAGTGKTLATIAVALDELRAGHYQKIMVFRSLHSLGQGQEMGFLPGDVDDKMNAWSGAIYDALDVLAAAKKPLKKNAGPQAIMAQKEESKRLRGMVEIAPITYLRGRSLSDTFMILEEAQNFSRSEILNILSRAGHNSKIVLTFDAAQIDNRFLQSGDKADIWSVIDDLKTTDIFAHITLKRTERSKIAEIASQLLS